MTIQWIPGRRRSGFAAFTSLLALTAAGAASAQNMPAGPTPAATATADAPGAIVVTGTRIVRDGFQAPTPLTVMTQEDIENSSPTNNIADFVNQLPALAGSTRPANSRLNLSSGQAGINALNLRNLGETRTLVLLDGRRSVASTVTGLVDVNTIPQALVERVEVSTGGASAAYGSDAVAGVVNFVLDKDFEGLRATGDIGVTSRGDGFNYSADMTAGTAFADGRGHLTLNAEIAHRDGIFNIDRAWNQTGYVRIQDPTWTSTSTTPQFLIRRQVGAANSTPGGLITASAGGTPNALRGLYFGDGGQVLQYQYGALTFPSPTGAAPPTLTQGGSWQVNDSGRRIGLDAEDDRRSVFGRLSFEVSDEVALFAEGSYNWQEVYFNAGPNLSTGIVLQANNPFLINALGADRLAGITTVTLATTALDLPFRAVNNKREVQRYTVGAEGGFEAFGSSAYWDIYGQYGRADLREQLRNIMHIARLNQATAAVSAPAGNAGGYAAGSIQCAINVDANAANDDRACVPLNRLGIGVADPTAINYVLGDPYRDQMIEQKVAGANLSLTPFSTWAGEVSIAVGAEYREEKIRGFVPEEYQPVISAAGTTTNRWSVGNYLPTNGKYDVKEAYLETVIPLGLGLEFNGAVRATDYSTAGYVTTWKAGAIWAPTEDIRLRVTRSRDIRAPNLNELYQAGTANSDSVRNPAYTPDGANGPASFGYSGNQVGNLNLRPEKTDSWNIGGVLSPGFLPGFNASIDYFRIELDQGINTFSAQNIIDLCFLGNAQFCDAYSVDPARSAPGQPYLLFRTQPFNAANQLVRGIDFDASYRLPLRTADGVTLRGVATRYIKNLFNSGVPGTVPLDSVGSLGGGTGLSAQTVTPKWIYRVSASYDTQGFTATAVGRGVSGGKYVANGIECQTGCPVSTPQAPTYDDNSIDGVFYADLNLTARVDGMGVGEAEVFVNITNLFDANPILLPETGLAANSTYSDLLGRAFRVGVRLRTR
jgi:outer membrane receptor protein involved in Fe transport